MVSHVVVTADETVACEDCGRVRAPDEAGWIAVRHRPSVHTAGGRLFYCPEHAAQFPLDEPDVVPVESGPRHE